LGMLIVLVAFSWPKLGDYLHQEIPHLRNDSDTNPDDQTRTFPTLAAGWKSRR